MAGMPRVKRWVALLVFAVVAIVRGVKIPDVVTASDRLNLASIDQISVSGLSSGGFMAVQLHVAHSKTIMGAGVVAGGPYWASNGNVAFALTILSSPELVSLTELWAATDYAFATASIDSPRNLARSKVYIWGGLKDSVVHPELAHKVLQYYSKYIPDKNIAVVLNVSAEHAWPTDNWGNPCDYLGDPYINNCGRSGAGEILHQIYGPLKPRQPARPGNLVKLDQATFLPAPWSRIAAGIDATGFAYIPTSCRNATGSCRLHIALHGCKDDYAYGGTTMVEHVGFNEWAEANDIIVLYPQTLPTAVNPLGCWDWWGYTGLNFATKFAVQQLTVMRMAQSFVKGTIPEIY